MLVARVTLTDLRLPGSNGRQPGPDAGWSVNDILALFGEGLMSPLGHGEGALQHLPDEERVGSAARLRAPSVRPEDRGTRSLICSSFFSNSKRAGLNCEKSRSDRSCVRNDSAALSVFSFGTLVFFRGLKGAISFYRYIKPRVVPDGTLPFLFRLPSVETLGYALPRLRRSRVRCSRTDARARFCLGSSGRTDARARFQQLMRWRAWVVGVG